MSTLTAISHAALRLAGIALLGMALAILGGILIPNLLQAPLPGVFELSESLMVACVFLPLAWTQARHGHVRMGFLRPRLHPVVRRPLDAVVAFFSLGFYGLLAWQGWVLAVRSLATREYAAGLIPFPLYPAKIILAAGLSLMTAQLVIDLVRAAFGREPERQT